MSYMKMGDVKSVKVDNWGVFFLQKLQNFFNKTDYCDLTLQFNDNSQLKVHRLVLSACTDYFNVLEQTCEVQDDILVMPRGLQADVVVPIVNFMYTGTLEFEISMYSRLLRTARDMNMTVLLKLLEAHKRTVESSRPQIVKRPPPKTFANRRPVPLTRTPIKVEQPYITASTSGRRIPLSAYQCKTLQIKPVTPSTSYYPQIPSSESASIVTKYAHGKTPVKGPSRFDCNDDTILPPDSFEQFDSISYESKPLITANQICKEDLEDYDNLIPAHDTSATFEQLRKSYTNNKRPSSSVSSFDSPPEKKPNIQDVKEYAEQQLMRKQIAAEYDDDNEFEDVLDDEFHNDDDDEDYVPPLSVQKQTRKSAIVIKQERDQKPTIVVKDTAGSNVNHAKIISEVLKKYPHLVKNNKNIKLKIMAKSTSSTTQNIVIKQEPVFDQSGTQMEMPRSITVNIPKSLPVQTSIQSKPTNVRSVVTQPAPTFLKSKTVPSPVAPAPVAPVSNTPRRIDSKTMHALIAKGAENTTGPWLCLRCGINGRPISIPSYRGFRRHLTNTHKERIDSRLCEHCGWRSHNNRELYHHMQALHQINPPQGYDFPKCDFCSNIFINKTAKELHIKEEHPEKIVAAQQQCMYCDGIFQDEDVLYNHMQSRHKLRAQKDGLIDYTDDEDDVYYSEAPAEQSSESKIKILSNIAIPQTSNKPGATINLEPSSEAAALSTVATGIATSLGLIDSSDSQEIQYLEESDFISTGGVTEPKFVNADGHIMELTPEQREEIISQLDNQHEGGVVMVLNEEPFEVAAAETAEITEDSDPIASTSKNKDEEKSDADKSPVKVNETETEEPMEWQNDSQGSVEQTTKAKVNNDDDDDDEEKEAPELKDAEEDDDSEAADDEKDPNDGDKTVDKAKIESAKENLKLLTGDWSDDEDEPEDEPVAEPETKSSEVKENDNTVESKEDEAEEEPTHENTEIPEKEILFETLTTGDKEISNDENGTDEKNLDDAKIDDKSTEDDESKETKNTAAEEDEESVGKILAEDDEGQTEETETTKLSEVKEEADEETEKIEKIPSDEKKITRSVSKERSSLEKDEDKTDSKNQSGKNDSKKKDGSDPIRSLINDWGDDDDEDDEDL